MLKIKEIDAGDQENEIVGNFIERVKEAFSLEEDDESSERMNIDIESEGLIDLYEKFYNICSLFVEETKKRMLKKWDIKELAGFFASEIRIIDTTPRTDDIVVKAHKALKTEEENEQIEQNIDSIESSEQSEDSEQIAGEQGGAE